MGSATPACSSRTAELFFSDNTFEQARALRLCVLCAVRRACRHAGADEPYGIWGGLTAEDRGFIKARSDAAPALRTGT